MSELSELSEKYRESLAPGRADLQEEIRKRAIIAGLKHSDAGGLYIRFLEEGLANLERERNIPEPWYHLGQISMLRDCIDALHQDLEIEEEGDN